MSRSSKKGPWVEERLMSRIEAMNQANQPTMGRTWSRASTIFPERVGHPIPFHAGRQDGPAIAVRAVRKDVRVFGAEEMVRPKLGEFAPTRTYRGPAATGRRR